MKYCISNADPSSAAVVQRVRPDGRLGPSGGRGHRGPGARLAEPAARPGGRHPGGDDRSARPVPAAARRRLRAAEPRPAAVSWSKTRLWSKTRCSVHPCIAGMDYILIHVAGSVDIVMEMSNQNASPFYSDI